MGLLTNSGVIWKSLNGVVCVYKPAEVSVRRLRETLINKIITELNYVDKQINYPENVLLEDNSNILAIEGQPKHLTIGDQPNNIESEGPVKYIVNRNETNTSLVENVTNNSISEADLKCFSLSKRLDLSNHPRVTGPKFLHEALPVSWSNFLGFNTSGVLVFGLRRGTQAAKFIRENLPTRCYQIKCKLGQATESGFANSKVVERSTWKYIRQFHMDRILAAMQAAHQKKMFEMCGVDMQSQLAYELAIKGPIRPVNSKLPIVYGMKCTEFIGPEFTLEIQCVNEYETYLAILVRDIGLKLHSTAHCISIKCIRHSCFTLEHALLMKHWTLEHIMGNMGLCAGLLDRNKHLLEQDSVALRQSA